MNMGFKPTVKIEKGHARTFDIELFFYFSSLKKAVSLTAVDHYFTLPVHFIKTNNIFTIIIMLVLKNLNTKPTFQRSQMFLNDH